MLEPVIASFIGVLLIHNQLPLPLLVHQWMTGVSSLSVVSTPPSNTLVVLFFVRIGFTECYSMQCATYFDDSLEDVVDSAGVDI